MTTLRRWKPGYITEEVQGNEETAKGGWLSPEHIEHFEKRDAMALYRAAKVNGCAERIFHGDRRVEGTPWYDAMEQIVDVNFEYTIDGVTKNLYARDGEAPGREDESIKNAGAERITARVTLEHGNGRRTVKLQGDFLVLDEYETDPRRAGVLVTTDSEASLEEMQELLEHTLFEQGYDKNDDSRETQQEDFRQKAHEAVCKLMLDAGTAQVEVIRYAVRYHVMHTLPKDGITQIRMRDDDVEVTLLPQDDAG